MSLEEKNTHTALQFEWEEVQETPILAVRTLEQRVMSDGTVGYEGIAFVLGEQAVVVTADIDTCQISVRLNRASDTDQWDDAPSFPYARGRKFGWSWVCIDHRGYKDAFIIAFSDVYDEPMTGAAMAPRLMFVGDGVGLRCNEINPCRPQ